MKYHDDLSEKEERALRKKERSIERRNQRKKKYGDDYNKQIDKRKRR